MAAAFRQHTSRTVDPQLHTHVVDRQPGGVPGWSLVGVGRPDDQGRPAHPVRPVPRRAAGRADRPARRPLGRPRARHRRDRRRPRDAPGRVLPAHRGGATPGRRQARPLRRGDGAGADGAGTLAARTRSRPGQPPREAQGPRRRGAAPPLGRPDRRPGPRPRRRGRRGSRSAGPDAGDRPVERDRDRGPGHRHHLARASRRGGRRSWCGSWPPPSRPAPASPAGQLVGWLDDVAEGVAVSRCVDLSRPVPPGALLRRDGRPVTESAVDRALTTQAILDQEAGLLAWADRRTTHMR